MTASLTGSLEDYLEAIYNLLKKDHEARSTQLAEMLHVKKSSVTVALRSLAKKKLINYSPYSDVTLTPEGEKAAQDIVRRHETLRDFLTLVLGVEAKMAEESACKMEHVLSKDITDKLNRFMEFIAVCPRNGDDWLKQYHTYCNEKKKSEACQSCIEQVESKIEAMRTGNKELTNVKMLSSLNPGQKGEIIKITHRGDFRKRILEMGVTTGAVLAVERVAPLGDPIDIKIRGYHLSLRKEEAKNIEVKILD